MKPWHWCSIGRAFKNGHAFSFFSSKCGISCLISECKESGFYSPLHWGRAFFRSETVSEISSIPNFGFGVPPKVNLNVIKHIPSTITTDCIMVWIAKFSLLCTWNLLFAWVSDNLAISVFISLFDELLVILSRGQMSSIIYTSSWLESHTLMFLELFCLPH